MKTRTKITLPAIQTRAEMETLIREITRLKLNEKLLVAGMDAEIQGVRDNYESRLATLTQVLAEKTAAALAWAQANPDEFGKRKSIEFVHGIIGFRASPPKLKTVLKWKWDGVLDALRAASWGLAYIRVKEEINKEQLIADVVAQTLSPAELLKVGAKVVHEESFFVESKLTKVDNRETATAETKTAS